MDMPLVALDARRLDEAVEVLSDAFADYPVMRFVIGDCGTSYAARLREMIRFFTMARLLNDDLVIGVTDRDALIAVANISRPGDRSPSPELDPLRERLWRELGADARQRYEQLGQFWRGFAIERSHYHLNMIGVRRTRQGQGAARLLLDALHERSARASDSCGVSLTTEVAANVALYGHFGYEIAGHAVITPEMQTWGLFRPNPEGRTAR